jgi:hypothetical protein
MYPGRTGGSMRRRVAAALGLSMLVAMAACDGDGDDESADRPAETSERDRAGNDGGPADDDAGDEDDGDRAGDDGQVTDVSDQDLPADQPLDVRVDHPGGVQLRVTSIAFERDHVALGLVATNGTDRLVLLSGDSLSDPMVLEDDRDNAYRFVPPQDDAATSIAETYVPVDAASTLEGTFVFAGRVHPDTTEFTLTTNPESDDTEPTAAVFRPRMVVEIPVGDATR